MTFAANSGSADCLRVTLATPLPRATAGRRSGQRLLVGEALELVDNLKNEGSFSLTTIALMLYSVSPDRCDMKQLQQCAFTGAMGSSVTSLTLQAEHYNTDANQGNAEPFSHVGSLT